jgi:glutamate formiminotransferase/formiminotetrahydrofolate cyclodeaminase
VGALCARAAVFGAGLNVRINAGSLSDAARRGELLGRAAGMQEEADRRERAILEQVSSRL